MIYSNFYILYYTVIKLIYVLFFSLYTMTYCRCDIPVIIMGETGCGKTRLIQFMCQLQCPDVTNIKNMLVMKVYIVISLFHAVQVQIHSTYYHIFLMQYAYILITCTYMHITGMTTLSMCIHIHTYIAVAHWF